MIFGFLKKENIVVKEQTREKYDKRTNQRKIRQMKCQNEIIQRKETN